MNFNSLFICSHRHTTKNYYITNYISLHPCTKCPVVSQMLHSEELTQYLLSRVPSSVTEVSSTISLYVCVNPFPVGRHTAINTWKVNIIIKDNISPGPNHKLKPFLQCSPYLMVRDRPECRLTSQPSLSV